MKKAVYEVVIKLRLEEEVEDEEIETKEYLDNQIKEIITENIFDETTSTLEIIESKFEISE